MGILKFRNSYKMLLVHLHHKLRTSSRKYCIRRIDLKAENPWLEGHRHRKLSLNSVLAPSVEAGIVCLMERDQEQLGTSS
jgi:hypothetical protein